jgi:thiamine pyrophosphokinase
VVAADGGAATALRFDFRPDVVVGDLDSIDRETLAELGRHGVPIETFPRDKDATDGQLAIERALRAQPASLLLVGFLGGPRLDQALSSVQLLLAVDAPATMIDPRNELTLVRPGRPLTWRPEPTEIISLLALFGVAEGVTTSGLRWRLDGDRLLQAESRGVSNEPDTDGDVTVALERGVLLVSRYFPGE